MANTNEINRNENIKAHFAGIGIITLADLRDFFHADNPAIPNSTINWRVHELVKDEVLKRTGRGTFALGGEIPYNAPQSKDVKRISNFLKKGFPLISFCVWDSSIINEFAHHLTGHPFLLVDVEKEIAESVYFQLKDQFKPVFFRLSKTLITNMLPDFDRPILVRNLATESPLALKDGIPIPTLEKLLIDLFSDPEFSYLQGNELKAIYRNAFYKYTVNENRLLRYASRKGKKEEVLKFISSANLSNQKLND
jgi:hypothetical protein